MVELFGPLIFHWCHRCRLEDCDAADIMQDVLLRAHRKVAVFEQRDANSLRRWLWQITQNRITDHFRSKQKREVAAGGTVAQNLLNLIPEEDVEEVSQIIESDEDPTESHEFSQLVQRALNQIRGDFSERSWQAFWNSVILKRETKMIAEELGISMAGVRQAKRRVLRRLRLQLGDVDAT